MHIGVHFGINTGVIVLFANQHKTSWLKRRLKTLYYTSLGLNIGDDSRMYIVQISFADFQSIKNLSSAKTTHQSREWADERAENRMSGSGAVSGSRRNESQRWKLVYRSRSAHLFYYTGYRAYTESCSLAIYTASHKKRATLFDYKSGVFWEQFYAFVPMKTWKLA